MKKYVKFSLTSLAIFAVLYAVVAFFFNDIRAIYYNIKQDSVIVWNGVKIYRHFGMHVIEDKDIIGIYVVGEEWKGGVYVKIEPDYDNISAIKYLFTIKKDYDLLALTEVVFKNNTAIHAVQKSKNKKNTMIDAYAIPSKKMAIGLAAKEEYAKQFHAIIDEMEFVE